MPGPGNMRGVRGMKSTVDNPLKVLGRLLAYVGRKYKFHMIMILVLIVVSVLASVQGTLFTRTLIDGYITPLMKSPNPDFGPLARAIGRVACFYAAGVIANYVQQRINLVVTQGTMRDLRDDMFSHMETLPIRYFDTHPRGDIMSMYTNDVDTLRQMISQSIPQLFNSAITIVSVLVSMLILSVPLTVLALALASLVVVVTRFTGGRSGAYFIQQQKNLGALNGYIEEMMAGQKVVKVFNHEEAARREFKQKNDELFNTAYNANRYANILMPFSAQLGNLNYVVIAIIGGYLAIHGIGGLTIGGLVSFLAFNRSFNMPINQVAMQFNAIVMAIAGADRVFKLLDEAPETDNGYVKLVRCREEDGKIIECRERTGKWAWKHTHQATGEVEYKPMRGEIVMEQVDFGYVPEKTVLYDIDLYAKPGQKIAFVGSTGAGKTTITNLINRFYDIQDGKIRYDGININKICKSDLRRSLGMVLQDTCLFTGTVRDNIRFGKLDATDEEIYAAAKLANADGFIRRLPDGYDTMLTGNGASLSQGQRQLLAIARAAIANPPVLILDEATSSIDTRTERIVQDGMDRLMAGRTSFVIAHRLSTVKNANCIMVLEKGRIIERGTHEQLLEQKGRYYQLYTGNAIAE